jgi:hypothetical protein
MIRCPSEDQCVLDVQIMVEFDSCDGTPIAHPEIVRAWSWYTWTWSEKKCPQNVIAYVTDFHHIVFGARSLWYISSPSVKASQHVCLPGRHTANCWVSVGGRVSRDAMENILHLRVESGKLEQVYGITHVIRGLFFCSGCGAHLCQTYIVDICGELGIEMISLL